MTQAAEVQELRTGRRLADALSSASPADRRNPDGGTWTGTFWFRRRIAEVRRRADRRRRRENNAGFLSTFSSFSRPNLSPDHKFGRSSNFRRQINRAKDISQNFTVMPLLMQNLSVVRFKFCHGISDVGVRISQRSGVSALHEMANPLHDM